MNGNKRGFTLIEIIGVLAIMAIVASALIPNIARQISRGMADAEDAELSSLCSAMISSVQTQHVIPNTVAAQWSAAAAVFLTAPAQKLTLSKGAGTRRLVVRPTNTLGPGGLPYNQSALFSAGAPPLGNLIVAPPLQARFFFVASLQNAAPALNIATNAQFDAVWDQTGAIPAGFTENDNLRIARLNLASCFFPVTLNRTTPNGNPTWALDAAAARGVPNPTASTVYIIQGTQIRLQDNAIPVAVVIVNKALTLTYSVAGWSF